MVSIMATLKDSIDCCILLLLPPYRDVVINKVQTVTGMSQVLYNVYCSYLDGDA